MSRCTHSERRASDSQDLGGLDSFSLPSETFVEDGKNTKSSGDRPIGKFDDALVDAPKKSSDGMRCNESDEFTPGKSSSLVDLALQILTMIM
ncbi:hypothetical protein ACS0TY_012917 [Phlomoides rotata]